MAIILAGLCRFCSCRRCIDPAISSGVAGQSYPDILLFGLGRDEFEVIARAGVFLDGEISGERMVFVCQNLSQYVCEGPVDVLFDVDDISIIYISKMFYYAMYVKCKSEIRF